jgi:shikimate dehydrogenase
MSKLYKLGVVGNPIEHSLSPFIHSRFARNENVNIEYLPYKVSEADFNNFIKEFFQDPLSRGLNITLPHKKSAAKIVGTISNEAKFINAVNTVAKEKEELSLFSTDGVGFISDISSNKKFNFKGANVLFIGAGAAAESILYKVAREEVSIISIMNRTQANAERLVRKFSNMTHINTFQNLKDSYDLIINCSSAGLTGEFDLTDKISTQKDTYFYDLNYSLVETPFCIWARTQSDNVYDGMGMLVHQAAHSFNKWFKVFPDTDLVLNDLEKMRE